MPKSELGFRTFDFGSVVKQFGFWHLSEIRTILFGFRHCPQTEKNCLNAKLDRFI